MEYKLKKLSDAVNVSEIANVHFFEFPSDFYTGTDSHPFAELVYVSSGVLDIRSEGYLGALKKGEAVIHAPDEKHSLSCIKGSAPTVIIIGFACTGLPLSVTGKRLTLSAEEKERFRNAMSNLYETYCADSAELIQKIIEQ